MSAPAAPGGGAGIGCSTVLGIVSLFLCGFLLAIAVGLSAGW
ncbi:MULTISPECIES: hypothetical protein [Actinomycetes]|nr:MULTISPECIES: hypothetical protein [Actinomycetes]